MLAYTRDMTWISKINMFVYVISSSYLFDLSDKYFKMSYPMDISITNIIKMFVHGISVFYLFEHSDKYFKMSYPMDNRYIGYLNHKYLYIRDIPPSLEPYATPEACLGTSLQSCARLSRLESCRPGCISPNLKFFN